MDVATVTLDEVLRASRTRSASLVPETAGYLALAVGDGAARLPFRVEDQSVKLTTEGTVFVERGKVVVPPQEAGRILRDMLARLLESSVGSMPCLSSAARPRVETDRGMEAVIEELESALIPVNRAAARRALARLARETVRAKQAGRLRRRAKAKRPRKMPESTSEPELEIPITVEPMADEPAPIEAARAPAEADVAPVERAPMDAAPAPAELALETDDFRTAEAEPTPTIFEDGLVTFERSEEALADDPAGRAAEDAEDAAVFDVDLSDRTILDVATVAQAEPVVPPAPAMPSDRDFRVAAQQGARRTRRRGRPREMDVEIVSSGPKSDVDDLLRGFAESKLGVGDVREVAAELKSMAGLDATPAPPQTAPHTIVMERPSEMDPPVIDAPALAFTPRRPGRVARAGMALKVVLLMAGIATTGLVWRYHPALFAGTDSPIAQDPQVAGP